jgi:hypothetical protein
LIFVAIGISSIQFNASLKKEEVQAASTAGAMVKPLDVLGFMYSGAALILGTVLMCFGVGF